MLVVVAVMVIMAMVVVIMVVTMIMVVIVTMTAAARATSRMAVLVSMIMVVMPAATTACMVMMVVYVIMRIVMVVMAATASMVMICMGMGMAVRMTTRLRFEGPRDMRNLAALTAHQFREHMIVLNINGIGCQLCRHMTITDQQDCFHKPKRIISLDFKQRFRCRFHKHQPAIIQFERIPIIQNGCLFKIEQKGRAFFPVHDNTLFLSAFVIQHDLVDHTLHFDRRLAQDRS